MECDYLYGWIKKKQTVTYVRISPKMVNPRDTAEMNGNMDGTGIRLMQR